jgi:hypothetical protein
MAVALIAYLIVVTLLGLAYAVLQGTSWLSADHLGWTLMAAAAMAVARQMRAVARLRILAFGSTADTAAPVAAETREVGDRGRTGSGGAPHTGCD